MKEGERSLVAVGLKKHRFPLDIFVTLSLKNDKYLGFNIYLQLLILYFAISKWLKPPMLNIFNLTLHSFSFFFLVEIKLYLYGFSY